MDQHDSSEPVSPPEQRIRARAVLRALPAGIHTVTLVCPLCGTSIPARGLRSKSLRGLEDIRWYLVFTCPACGLVSDFNTDQLSVERIEALQGSSWSSKLRQYAYLPRAGLPEHTRRVNRRYLVGTFVVAFLTWMLLIGNLNPVEVLWGVIVSAVIARVTYGFAAIDLPTWMLRPSRWLAFFELSVEFVRQIIVQNITLSIRVLRPSLPIRPGIVAVPTTLRDDVALTVLGSLMTLTPDTITMDIDQKRGLIYVHWIDVTTTDIPTAQRLISASLEEKISRWIV